MSNETDSKASESEAEAIGTSLDVLHNQSVDLGDISSALVSAIGSGQNYAWTSLKLESRNDRLAMARHLTGKENSIEQLLGSGYFDVVDVIIAKVSFFDSEGQQVTTPKCILVGKDGNTITIMARVWVTEFVASWQLLGQPPFNPPVRVAAKQTKGNGANRYYSLVLP